MTGSGRSPAALRGVSGVEGGAGSTCQPVDTEPVDTEPVVVAAFDFDGTLTRSDTVVDFLYRACGRRRVVTALGRALAAERTTGRQSRRASARRDRIKERVSLDLLSGRPAAELQAIGAAFAADIQRSRLRPHMVARLEGHKTAGHSVVVVSASYSFYLKPLGEALGLDAVLCTTVEVDGDGICTGRLEGGNCRGAEKVARLEAWADGRPFELHAYGDSAGDAELLSSADVATWVKRSRKAR